MATEVDAFWTTSGRVDSFAFEQIDPDDLTTHLGWLDGVTGGSLTWGFYTDLKVSGSLNITSTSMFTNCVVRIHYMPRLGATQKDIILCTCIAEVESMIFDKGLYVGTVGLKSMLQQYLGDKLYKDFTVGKNKSCKAEFKRLINTVGGKGYTYKSATDKTTTASQVIEKGSTPMQAINAIADKMGAQVSVTPNGYLKLTDYISPGNKTCSLRLPTGEDSVTEQPVEVSNDSATKVNRVFYTYNVTWNQVEYLLDKNGKKQTYTSGKNKGKYKTTKKKKSKAIVGKATVKSSSELHRSNTGRWISATYEKAVGIGTWGIGTGASLEKKLNKLQTEANSAAADKMAAYLKLTYYTIECSYLPVEIGQVVEFEHVESGRNIHCQAIITDIDMNIGTGARMKIKMRRVRLL